MTLRGSDSQVLSGEHVMFQQVPTRIFFCTYKVVVVSANLVESNIDVEDGSASDFNVWHRWSVGIKRFFIQDATARINPFRLNLTYFFFFLTLKIFIKINFNSIKLNCVLFFYLAAGDQASLDVIQSCQLHPQVGRIDAPVQPSSRSS